MSSTNKTIQQKIEELNQMLAWFDSDDFSIEAAMEKYKLAEAQASEIESDLNGYKNEINVIKQRFDTEA